MKIARHVLIAGCLAFAGLIARAQAPEPAVPLSIAAQPMPDALNALAEQTGLHVVFPAPAVEGRVSPKLEGKYTPRAALKILLLGTQLSYEFVDAKTIAIRDMSVPVVSGERPVAAANTQFAQAGAPAPSPVSRDSSGQPANGETGSSPVLEEVVVTAQKRKERLLDVPIAITAISGDDLDASRIRDISDLALAVPGLSVDKNAPGQMQIAIRGITSERGDAALTGIYLDEVPLTAAVGEALGSVDLGTQDLQRVEVLKGPQGTLFGDGSVGGTVRYITRDPVLDKVEGSLRSSYYLTNGGDPSWDVRGVANFPVVDGVFAVRAVGSYEDSGGWIDKVAGPGQPVLERNINDGKSHDFRIKALFKPSDDLSITGLVGIGRFNGGANNNVNVDPLDESHFRPAANPNRDEVNSYKYNVYNLTATYALGFANLMSSTSQYKTDRSNSFSQMGFIAGGALFLQVAYDQKHIEVNAFSQELRLTSSADGRFKWTTGVFYKDSKALANPNPTDSRAQLAIGSSPPFNPSFGPPTDSTSKTKAAFGDISYQLTSRLEAGGGLRYVEDQRSGYDPTRRATTFNERTYDKLTYRAFASYKLADDVNVYANTSTGFRAGMFNGDALKSLGAPYLTKPENVVAYELGAKARFLEGKLYSSISLFRNEYQDILGTFIYIDQVTGRGTGFNYNIGNARIDGVEWDVQWSPMHNWTLGFAGDVLNSRYTELNSNAQPLVKVGDPVNFSPKNGVSVFTQLGINLAADAHGTFRVDWNRRGRSRDTERNFLWVPDIVESSIVNFVNARFDVDWHDWTYGVFAQNILDDRGTLNASTPDLQWQSRPRSIGLTASRRF